MTNADCIRRMSDDQLYDFLSEWECGDIDYSITFCDLCKQGGNELGLDCDGCREHWLKRDAVDYGGLMYWKRNTTYSGKDSEKAEDVIAFLNLHCPKEMLSQSCARGYARRVHNLRRGRRIREDGRMSEIIMKIGLLMIYGGCIMAVGGVMIWLIGLMIEETL